MRLHWFIFVIIELIYADSMQGYDSNSVTSFNDFFTSIKAPPFVTDCDNTLLHYDTDVSVAANIDLIQLPASAGSGISGYISTQSIDLLHQISNFTTIICSSGMRAATMRQRAPYLPFIKYWICENGGRIFRRNYMKADLIANRSVDWNKPSGLTHYMISS